jgi:endogenous inhibitor of DNA gyrase (YacG/DUF329 family)
VRCPTCRAPVARDPARPNKLFPFCSERCHLVDLGRWLGEDYRIPGPPLAPVAAEGLVAQLPDED